MTHIYKDEDWVTVINFVLAYYFTSLHLYILVSCDTKILILVSWYTKK